MPTTSLLVSVDFGAAFGRLFSFGRGPSPALLRCGENAIVLAPGSATFSIDDLHELTVVVADAWSAGFGADWAIRAGSLEWSCLATADHAVDCVYAPAFMLASRRTESYPVAGEDLRLKGAATPEVLVESLWIATRLLAGVVKDTDASVRAIIFRRPEALTGAPPDFVARAAVELALHAHDVCAGLGTPFALGAEAAVRLREHTRHWPMWSNAWSPLDTSIDAWGDILRASGRFTQDLR